MSLHTKVVSTEVACGRDLYGAAVGTGPSSKVRLTSATAVATVTEVPLVFSTVVYDVGSNWSAGSYTVPAATLCELSGSIKHFGGIDASADDISVRVKVDGVVVLEIFNPTVVIDADVPRSIMVFARLNLAANAVITVHAYNSSGGEQTISTDSYFEVRQLEAGLA